MLVGAGGTGQGGTSGQVKIAASASEGWSDECLTLRREDGRPPHRVELAAGIP